MNIKLSLFIALFTITNNITTGPILNYLVKELKKINQELLTQPQLSPREYSQPTKEKQEELSRLTAKGLTLIGMLDCMDTHDLSESDAAEKCYNSMLRGAKISKSTMEETLEQSKKEWLQLPVETDQEDTK